MYGERRKMYERKTRDEYAIYSNYGYGFELTCYCDDWPDAKQMLRDYRENEPQYVHKIVKKRVEI